MGLIIIQNLPITSGEIVILCCLVREKVKGAPTIAWRTLEGFRNVFESNTSPVMFMELEKSVGFDNQIGRLVPEFSGVDDSEHFLAVCSFFDFVG